MSARSVTQMAESLEQTVFPYTLSARHLSFVPVIGIREQAPAMQFDGLRGPMIGRC
jgi:hypothetical protein